MYVTTSIIQRVFQIFHNEKLATAYTIEKGDRQYLVSASHTFDGSPDVTSLLIYRRDNWVRVPVTVVFNADSRSADTIVFLLDEDISPRHPMSLNPAGLIIGTWAYFLGYPRGMRTSDRGINRGYPLPFVKAALVSATDFERHGFNTLFLDGHNNKGFSGGPVVWAPPNKPSDVRIVGTISGYVVEHPIHGTTKEELSQHETNAGIIEAYWVRDLLEKLP